jgi:hypothetical protein
MQMSSTPRVEGLKARLYALPWSKHTPRYSRRLTLELVLSSAIYWCLYGLVLAGVGGALGQAEGMQYTGPDVCIAAYRAPCSETPSSPRLAHTGPRSTMILVLCMASDTRLQTGQGMVSGRPQPPPTPIHATRFLASLPLRR